MGFGDVKGGFGNHPVTEFGRDRGHAVALGFAGAGRSGFCLA